MARKVTVSKFKYFILKLWEFARLFTAMACVNLVFSPQKLNSNGTLQLDTRGFNASFSCWIPKCLNWTDSERLSKRVFVVELKTSGIKDALSVSNTSETDSLMADLTRSSMEWCFSFVNQWSISCNPTREINRWWGETGVIGKEEKIANNEAQHTLCAIVCRMWSLQVLCCCSALIAHYSSNSQSSPSSVPWLVFPTWHFSSVSFVWWKRNVSGPQFFVSGALPLGIAADSVLVVCLCSTIEVNKL